MFDYTQLKTYSVISKNYFWNNYDLAEFMEHSVLEYEDMLNSSESLKIILRDLDRVKRKILCKAENLFKEVVGDDFTYILKFFKCYS